MPDRACGVDLADHRVPELRPVVVDRMAADDGNRRLIELGGAAGDDPLQQSGAQSRAREGRDAEREQRPAADGVDVAEGVGGGDGSVGERVVDDGREEVDRRHQGAVARDAIDRRVVAGGRITQHIRVDDRGQRPELAWELLDAIAAAGVSVAAVSFGSNDATTAVAPMDWGVLIPLWFMGGRSQPPVRAVVVTPARELAATDHIAAGAAIASVAARSDARVAFIASADHGHAHLASGPYGFDPAAAEYDAVVTELVRSNRLEDLVDIGRDKVESAKADSWWQMVMLHGATRGWRGTLLSYDAPTYFGMLTAAYEPPDQQTA